MVDAGKLEKILLEEKHLPDDINRILEELNKQVKNEETKMKFLSLVIIAYKRKDPTLFKETQFPKYIYEWYLKGTIKKEDTIKKTLKKIFQIIDGSLFNSFWKEGKLMDIFYSKFIFELVINYYLRNILGDEDLPKHPIKLIEKLESEWNNIEDNKKRKVANVLRKLLEWSRTPNIFYGIPDFYSENDDEKLDYKKIEEYISRVENLINNLLFGSSSDEGMTNTLEEMLQEAKSLIKNNELKDTFNALINKIKGNFDSYLQNPPEAIEGYKNAKNLKEGVLVASSILVSALASGYPLKDLGTLTPYPIGRGLVIQIGRRKITTIKRLLEYQKTRGEPKFPFFEAVMEYTERILKDLNIDKNDVENKYIPLIKVLLSQAFGIEGYSLPTGINVNATLEALRKELKDKLEVNDMTTPDPFAPPTTTPPPITPVIQPEDIINAYYIGKVSSVVSLLSTVLPIYIDNSRGNNLSDERKKGFKDVLEKILNEIKLDINNPSDIDIMNTLAVAGLTSLVYFILKDFYRTQEDKTIEYMIAEIGKAGKYLINKLGINVDDIVNKANEIYKKYYNRDLTDIVKGKIKQIYS